MELTTLPQTMTPQQMAQFQQQLSQGYGGGGYSMQPTDPYAQLFQSIAPFLTGAGNLATANLDMNTARQAAGMADPFSGERQQYMTGLRDYMGANPVNPGQVTAGSNNALAQLTNLLQNPGSLTGMPGYQFGLNQAMEGVNRGAGASGLLNSGNRLAALEDRGNSYAQGWQNQIFNQLLGNVNANNSVAQLGLQAQGQGYNQLQHLAGADTGSPTAAAQALLNGRQQQANSVGSGIAGLGAGASSFISAMQRILGGSGGGAGGFNVPANGTTMGPPDDLFGNTSGIYGPSIEELTGGSLLDSTSSLGTSSDIFANLFDVPFG